MRPVGMSVSGSFRVRFGCFTGGVHGWTHELPIGVGPEDHPLLGAVQGKAVVEQLGALLTPIAAPVAAGEP
jgi:hypothetical protein